MRTNNLYLFLAAINTNEVSPSHLAVGYGNRLPDSRSKQYGSISRLGCLVKVHIKQFATDFA
jgi:hypothetical protein